MRKQSPFLFICLLVVAGVLTFFKVPLASSQGVTIMATHISGALPQEDVQAAVWEQATAVAIPLSAQMIARPIFPQANIKEITARALYNESHIAFLVEWTDDTMDDSAVRVQDFADSVALQFPLLEGQPFFCMGQQGGNVNLWHWKADWQTKIAMRQDMDTIYPNMYVDDYPFADEAAGASAPVESYRDVNYVPALAVGNLMAAPTYTSPVEDLIAGGFGSLTAQPLAGQNVQGHGVYADGKWRVIFSRQLVSGDAEDAAFVEGQVYSVAFAAWDGANEERNGQKSTSQWVSLQLGSGGGVSTAPSTSTRSTPSQPASRANDMEGVPFIFVPMFLVIGLLGLAALIFWLITKLPDKKN
jgi:hypothetical protein